MAPSYMHDWFENRIWLTGKILLNALIFLQKVRKGDIEAINCQYFLTCIFLIVF